MNEQFKSLLFLGFFVFVLFKECSGCFGTSSPSSLVGNKYELDEYHVVYFKTQSNILEQGQTLYSFRHSGAIEIFKRTG